MNLLDVAVETNYYDTTYGKYSTIICGILIFITIVVTIIAFRKLSKKEKIGKNEVAYASADVSTSVKEESTPVVEENISDKGEEVNDTNEKVD